MAWSHWISVLSLVVLARAQSNSSVPLTGTSVTTEYRTFSLTVSAACACTKLSSGYPADLFYPNSTNYTAENIAAWDVRTNLDPACIFVPADADAVAEGVKILNGCDAQFAVRGGGHTNVPGASNINGGVMVALSALTDIKLSADNSSVEVAPGLRWYDVYSYLEPYGLAVIGGRMKTIGVPGLTLIGGVHYFINKYGFAMDNVLSYDVVLGNGTQVTANAIVYSDLFWALKGGANNFGIVTKFTLKTHYIPQVSTVIQQWNESAVPAFIDATCQLASNDNADIAAGAIITITYNTTTGVVAPSLLGVQAGTENPPSRFSNFSSVPAVIKLNNVTSLAQWASTLDSPLQMFRVTFAQHTIKPDSNRLYAMYKAWKAAVDTVADVDGIYPTFVLNIAPRSAATVAKSNGIGNTWDLDDSESHIWWQVSTGWNLAQDDLRMQSWVRHLAETLHEENRALGLSTEFIYMGDAGEYQDPFVGFTQANVQKMKSIRSKYDIDGVFTRLNWGGFKLGY